MISHFASLLHYSPARIGTRWLTLVAEQIWCLEGEGLCGKVYVCVCVYVWLKHSIEVRMFKFSHWVRAQCFLVKLEQILLANLRLADRYTSICSFPYLPNLTACQPRYFTVKVLANKCLRRGRSQYKWLYLHVPRQNDTEQRKLDSSLQCETNRYTALRSTRRTAMVVPCPSETGVAQQRFSKILSNQVIFAVLLQYDCIEPHTQSCKEPSRPSLSYYMSSSNQSYSLYYLGADSLTGSHVSLAPVRSPALI